MRGRLHTWAGLVPAPARFQVAALLQDAVGNARVAATCDLLTSLPAVVLCIDDEPVAAAIGRQADGGFVLQAIAVELALRGSGLGRRLLDEVSRVGRYDWIEAETDQDSVEFYRRCGFAVTSLGEKYPGVERFRCRRPLEGKRTDQALGDTTWGRRGEPCADEGR